MTEPSEEHVEAILSLVNAFAPYPDELKRRLIRNFLASMPEEIADVMRGVETAKMRMELKRMQRSPQKYARKMP